VSTRCLVDPSDRFDWLLGCLVFNRWHIVALHHVQHLAAINRIDFAPAALQVTQQRTEMPLADLLSAAAAPPDLHERLRMARDAGLVTLTEASVRFNHQLYQERTFRSSLEQIVEFSDVRPKEHDNLFSEVGQIENEPLLDTALLDDEHVNPFHHLEHMPGSRPLSRVTGLVGQRLVTFGIATGYVKKCNSLENRLPFSFPLVSASS
jgi:hypothetical protein